MKLPKMLSALAARSDLEPMEAKLVEHLPDSLLLGLYDSDGMLDPWASPRPSNKDRATARLEALISPPSFTGNAPGGQSRWSTGA